MAGVSARSDLLHDVIYACESTREWLMIQDERIAQIQRLRDSGEHAEALTRIRWLLEDTETHFKSLITISAQSLAGSR